MTTNQEFADRIGVHFTMASRLRGGARRPSMITLRRIAEAYELPEADLINAYHAGREPDGTWVIGRYIREHIFINQEDTADDQPEPQPAA